MTAALKVIYRCWRCTRRLNVDDVRGTVIVYCPKCKSANRLGKAES